MTIVLAYLIAVAEALGLFFFIMSCIVGLALLWCFYASNRSHARKVRIAPKYTPRPVRGPQQKEGR